jgi:geranylgeranylglycerol-phosphate geranylgeranyltransferase
MIFLPILQFFLLFINTNSYILPYNKRIKPNIYHNVKNNDYDLSAEILNKITNITIPITVYKPLKQWDSQIFIDSCLYLSRYYEPNEMYNRFQRRYNRTLVLKRIMNIKNKINSFLRLIRVNSILPTSLLCFSGGWIMTHSLSKLIHSTSFIVATINTLIILSSSMIINDLFDIDIDKINNPKRPLVTGEITIKEAKIALCILFGLTEYLTFRYLSLPLRIIIQLAILNIIVYTPFVKKLTFLKNISCSSLVSFTSFFTGLASYNGDLMNSNIAILTITSSLVFFGSLNNELLLDMSDYEGDKKNNINTIPVVYGNEFSWKLAHINIFFNFIFHSLLLTSIYDYKYGLPLLFIGKQMLDNLNSVKTNHTKSKILQVVNGTNKQLIFLLLYLCGLSRK